MMRYEGELRRNYASLRGTNLVLAPVHIYNMRKKLLHCHQVPFFGSHKQQLDRVLRIRMYVQSCMYVMMNNGSVPGHWVPAVYTC
jgi:hypothetical protein